MAAGFADVEALDFSDPRRHERASGTFSWTQLRRSLGVRRAILEGPLFDIAYLTVASSTIGRLRDVLLLDALQRKARRIVVHVHQGSFGRVTSVPMAFLTRRTMTRAVDRYLFLAPRLARSAPWVPADRVRIVPNPPGRGVTPSPDEVVESIRRRDHERLDVRLLFLANMLPGKGHERLLEALPQILQGVTEEHRLRVDFVGAWPSRRKRVDFEERAAALGLDDVIRIHGATADRARILQLLSGARALVFPSTYELEGAPLAVIEALGAGTPVVATRHAALPDLVDHGRTGRLVSAAATSSELGDAVLDLVTAPAWASIAKAARDAYDERFAEAVVERAFRDALLT